MRKSRELRAVLVRRISRWDEENLIESEIASRRFGSLQVSDVDRIESSTEKRDVHRLESPMGRCDEAAPTAWGRGICSSLAQIARFKFSSPSPVIQEIS